MNWHVDCYIKDVLTGHRESKDLCHFNLKVDHEPNYYND